MRDNEKTKHALDMAFVLVLFFAFALAAFSLTAQSAAAYWRVGQSTASANQGRTALAYISNKVRQCGMGYVSVENHDGTSVLILVQEYENGEQTATAIFARDGYLMELEMYIDGGQWDLDMDFAEPVIGLKLLTVSIDGETLYIDAAAENGELFSTSMGLYAKGGAQ